MNNLQAVQPEMRTAQMPAPLVPSDFNQAMRLAEMMASANLVPDHLKGKAADCLMVVEQAARWRMSPFAVAQATSLIHGKLMYEGKLVGAAVHNSGLLAGRLSFEFDGSGSSLAVTVSGTLRGEQKARAVTVELDKVSTDNNFWKSQPEQQLCYAGTRIWARRHVPEVMLGVYSPEEEFEPEVKDISPPAEPAQPRMYPPADFETNFPAWQKAIESGRAEPESVIAMVENKGQLTAEMKKRIRDCIQDAEVEGAQ